MFLIFANGSNLANRLVVPFLYGALVLRRLQSAEFARQRDDLRAGPGKVAYCGEINVPL